MYIHTYIHTWDPVLTVRQQRHGLLLLVAFLGTDMLQGLTGYDYINPKLWRFTYCSHIPLAGLLPSLWSKLDNISEIAIASEYGACSLIASLRC